MKPNVIFIVVDDQGVSDVEMNPHATPIHMPHLTRLADTGVSCTQGYANASMCSPARSGILTGGYQQRFGVYGLEDTIPGIPDEHKLAPQYFKDIGYRTALIGKWHLGGLLYPEKGPLQKGFDHAFYWHGSTHDYWDPAIGNTALYDPLITHSPILCDGVEVTEMEYLTREITSRSLRFIEENRAEPLFLSVMHHVPHVPLQLPKAYYDKYAALGLGPKAAAARGMYEIMDEGIGLILEKLEQLGLRENTLVIYTSDNGGAFPSGPTTWPYHGGKFNMTEAGIRVPLVFSWPASLPCGKLYHPPVMHKEMLATSLAAAGVADIGQDGVNLLPYLRGETSAEPNDALFWCDDPDHRNMAVRRGKWKLTRNLYRQGLFDLERDPVEKYDVAADHPTVVGELLDLYNDWFSLNAASLYGPADREKVEKMKAAKLADPKTPRCSFLPMFGPEQEGTWKVQ